MIQSSKLTQIKWAKVEREGIVFPNNHNSQSALFSNVKGGLSKQLFSLYHQNRKAQLILPHPIWFISFICLNQLAKHHCGLRKVLTTES